MQIESFIVAKNGFVIEDSYGNFHIAKTLLEAAQIVGEITTNVGSTSYVSGFDSNDLNNVKYHMREGRKIEAIKLLRNCFTPRLGLREAKDLVEQLCG